ncbi:choice-of-anchor J domain-containing protein [Burkholderiaceae bacterium UC74_6]
MFKIATTALLLAGAMATAHADSSTPMFSQNFDNVGSLTSKGWIITNDSTPVGTTSWFQGDQSQFTSHSGAPESYAAVNFNSSDPNGGTLSTWLITPVISTARDIDISFWARSAIADPFFDQLAFGMLGSNGSLGTFIEYQLITTVGEWTQYTMHLAGQGEGATARFAIEYVGDSANANYAGVDDLIINVPEPSTWALVGISMLGLAYSARRRPQR